MPRGTTLRNVRIADDLWQRARAIADRRGDSLSDVLRGALERYVKRHGSEIGNRFICPTCGTRLTDFDPSVRARSCPNGHGWMTLDE